MLPDKFTGKSCLDLLNLRIVYTYFFQIDKLEIYLLIMNENIETMLSILATMVESHFQAIGMDCFVFLISVIGTLYSTITWLQSFARNINRLVIFPKRQKIIQQNKGKVTNFL